MCSIAPWKAAAVPQGKEAYVAARGITPGTSTYIVTRHVDRLAYNTVLGRKVRVWRAGRPLT